MSIPRRGPGWFLVIVTACAPACAGAPPAQVATTVETRPQPAGSLRAELRGGLSPEGPVIFSLGDSVWTTVFEVIPERGAFVLFPEVGDGDRHLLPAGEHVVGPAPEHRPDPREACGPRPPVRYRLLLAAGDPLRLDRLRLRRVPGESWWRVEAVDPMTPTESAVERLRTLARPGHADVAEDVAAFPYRCEEVSPPRPALRPPPSAGAAGRRPSLARAVVTGPAGPPLSSPARGGGSTSLIPSRSRA